MVARALSWVADDCTGVYVIAGLVMAWEPEPIAVTDLGNGCLRVRIRSSFSDGMDFSAALGMAMRVNGRPYRVSFVTSVPGSGRTNVPKLLDLVLRLIDED